MLVSVSRRDVPVMLHVVLIHVYKLLAPPLNVFVLLCVALCMWHVYTATCASVHL